MPRSFLVKKKAGSVGMPRPVSVCMPAGLPELPPLRPDLAPGSARTALQGVPCASIFSPAKLCSSPSTTLRCDDLAFSSYTPRTPDRCPSAASSCGSASSPPLEPINYSTCRRSGPGSPGESLSPSWPGSSPGSSPEPAGSPWGGSVCASPPGGEAAHLPFLALSFKRLQEMHMKAVESRLQGISVSPPRNNNHHHQHQHHHPHHHHQGSPPPPAAPHSPPTYAPALSPHHYRHHQHQLQVQHQHQQQVQHQLQHQQQSMVTSSSPVKMVATLPVPPTSPDSVLPPSAALPHHRDVSYWTASEHLQSAAPMDSVSGPQEEAPRRRKEGEPPRYQCEACNKSYATFSGLSKHKQFHCTTLIKKEFICKHCDKKYVSLGALKMHIRTHTLPCKCHICGKAFSRPWLLQGHVRTHTGEKPFPCIHCGRSFADRSNLRAHLQTHTDIKKYNCRSCSKSFSRSSLLHKHMDNGCGSTTGVVRTL